MIALLGGQTKEDLWFESVVVHNVEVGKEASSSLDDTDLEISEGDELGVY